MESLIARGYEKMPTRKIGRILEELEKALIQAGLSEEDAAEYVDGVEEEIEDLLDEEDGETSDSDKESG